MYIELIIYLILVIFLVVTFIRENRKLGGLERWDHLKEEQKHKFIWLVMAHQLSFMLILILPIVEHLVYKRTNLILTVAGCILLISGRIIDTFMGIRKLGNATTAFIEPPKDGRLVINGIYRYIRHPIYLGQILIAVGVPLILNSYYTLLISTLLIIILLIRVYLEEKEMRSIFPGYEDYISATKRFIPYLF